jgi:predicted small lipoprotein YifL
VTLAFLSTIVFAAVNNAALAASAQRGPAYYPEVHAGALFQCMTQSNRPLGLF